MEGIPMSKYFFCSTALFAALLFAAPLLAAQPQNIGPKTIKLKMGTKSLVFTHHKHQKAVDNQCWECHDKNVGKISNWSEATAHRLCIPCHDLNEKGPINCKGCHRK